MTTLADLELDTYQSHYLHDDSCDWPETNCYVDLWIESLHRLDLDPVAGMAFVLSSGFDGEQWRFFKFPPEDLRMVYGIEVDEMNAWRPLAEHIRRHSELGHLLTIEADSWFLPDTAGVSYRLAHQKSSIVPVAIDEDSEELTYIHNRGCYRLRGEDYRAVLQVDRGADVMPPYVEVVDLNGLQRFADADLRTIVDQLVVGHLSRRPTDNPIAQLSARVGEDLEWLRGEDPDTFHQYAFGTLRQLGAWAACAGAFTRWLNNGDLEGAAREFSSISESAKTCQFLLARAARGRSVDLATSFDSMATSWSLAYESLCGAYGI